MSDLLHRAERLQSKALQKAQENAQEAQTRKRQAFAKVKEASPDTAQFLQDVAAAFGKPSAVKLSVEGQTIYEQGEFAKRGRWMESVIRTRRILGLEQ